MIVVIAGFKIDATHSIGYRKFDLHTSGNLDKLVVYFRKMIEDKDISVISTRKVVTPADKE